MSVQVGRESDPDYIQNGEQLSQRVKFADVLHRLGRQQPKSNDYYITANDFLFRQPGLSTMLADIHPLYKGLMRDPDPEDFSRGVDIWMGPKGTVSPLHQARSSRRPVGCLNLPGMVTHPRSDSAKSRGRVLCRRMPRRCCIRRS